MGSMVFILVGAAVYFMPYFVASIREKRNKASIGIVNLFLGWTVIGWAVALAWAAAKDQPPTFHVSIRFYVSS